MSVLGACLVNAKAAALAAARLRPSDFFDDTRRLTFATIQRLVQAGTPIDRVTVKTAEPGIPATGWKQRSQCGGCPSEHQYRWRVSLPLPRPFPE
jgi:hypothetical protein